MQSLSIQLSFWIRWLGASGAGLLLSLLFLAIAFTSSAKGANLAGCTQAELQNALAGGGTVNFTQACSITLSSPLAVTRDVVLDAGGNSVTISGNGTVRIFTVASNLSFEVRGVALTSGSATEGGAIRIDTGAIVRLARCLLSGNKAAGIKGLAGQDGDDSSGIGEDGSAGGQGWEARGAAVFNQGSLTLEGCRFLTNGASGGDGGAGGAGGDGRFQGGDGGPGANGGGCWGGAVFNTGQLIITNTSFEGNTAAGGAGGAGGAAGVGPSLARPGVGGSGAEGSGAAIYSIGTVVAQASTFSGNRANGGASAAGGTFHSGNGSDGTPGGVSMGGAIYSSGGLIAVNCTFSDNASKGGTGGNGGPARWTAGKGGDGGAATGGAIASQANAAVTNCTLAQNGAFGGTNGVAGKGSVGNSDGQVGSSTGGGFAQVSGGFSLKNTIVAYSSSGGNGAGAITDLGWNISSDNSFPLGSSSQAATDPKLGALASNGGPTATRLPLPGSSAIQGANLAEVPAVDQRGWTRPGRGKLHPDIGAVDVVPAFISADPTNVLAAIGQSVTFSVVGGGESPLHYLWRFNGTAITQATNSSYTISPVTNSHIGGYTVVVTNAYGSVTSQVAQLNLKAFIVSGPTSVVATNGQDVTFSAVGGGDPPLHYTWLFNGTALNQATNSSCTISNVTDSNAGGYAVVVTNAYGSATSQVAQLIFRDQVAISGFLLVSNQPVITMPGWSGITYVTDYKALLTATNWVPVSTNIATNSIIIIRLPPQPPGSTSAFYRVRIY